MTAVQRGQWAEDLAHTYLSQQGWQTIQRNYRCKGGEIDLILQRQDLLIFVEVRYRLDQRYGGSLESIHKRKQQRIIQTARHYLQTHPLATQYRCRFDVVLVSGPPTDPTLRWIPDAFRSD